MSKNYYFQTEELTDFFLAQHQLFAWVAPSQAITQSQCMYFQPP